MLTAVYPPANRSCPPPWRSTVRCPKGSLAVVFASLGAEPHDNRCLHLGEVIYGNVGAPDRLDFTVQGAAVNRAARLEGLTQRVGVPMLLSREFAEQVNYPVSSLDLHRLRGVAEVQEVFALEAHVSH
jgi:class 3 adenylate cyclase